MKVQRLKLSTCLVLCIIFLYGFSGCSALDAKKGKKKGSGYSLFKKLEKDEKPVAPMYYEFKNILIPGELKEIKDKTSIVNSSDTESGTMLFNGSVDESSLVIFFKTNMKKDGWQLVSYFKSSFATSLLFHTDNKWCLISISEEVYMTDVRICVAPALYKVSGM
jgi:hypothetical protein